MSGLVTYSPTTITGSALTQSSASKYTIVCLEHKAPASLAFTSPTKAVSRILTSTTLLIWFWPMKELVPRLARYSAQLVGTRQFWVKKGGELKAIAKGITDATAVFITLSCADHQWYDLMRHMPCFEQWKNATTQQRKNLVRDSVQQNPHIIAAWLEICFQLFKTMILLPLFGFRDFWYRYEWQAWLRSHTHAHLDPTLSGLSTTVGGSG